MSELEKPLSEQNRWELLRWVRESARRILGRSGGENAARPTIDGRFGGAFVTFWSGRDLRGCVGTFAPTSDLAATIAEVTSSSLKDPRFEGDPITAAELPILEIEVSILTDPEPTSDPMSLVPGRHGVIVRRGGRSGCFLPKVAAERGWSAVEFLSKCCTMKAGLDAEAWRDGKTQVLLFMADSFRESDFSRV